MLHECPAASDEEDSLYQMLHEFPAASGDEEDSFDSFLSFKLSKPDVVIPPRLIDINSFIRPGFTTRQKIVASCRSNHVLLAHDLKDMTVVFFTNQRLRTILLQNLDSCRLVLMDSLDVKTGDIWLENLTNCTFVIDQVDLRRLHATNVRGCSFCFSNSEGSLLDEHLFLMQNCTDNRIVKVELVRGNDPNVNPELPIQRETAVWNVAGVTGEGRFCVRGEGFVFEEGHVWNKAISELVAEFGKEKVPSNDVLRELYAAELAEFRDSEIIVAKQVRRIADMILEARGRCVVFAGAGIRFFFDERILLFL